MTRQANPGALAAGVVHLKAAFVGNLRVGLDLMFAARSFGGELGEHVQAFGYLTLPPHDGADAPGQLWRWPGLLPPRCPRVVFCDAAHTRRRSRSVVVYAGQRHWQARRSV